MPYITFVLPYFIELLPAFQLHIICMFKSWQRVLDACFVWYQTRWRVVGGTKCIDGVPK